jgi:hypothetical protein
VEDQFSKQAHADLDVILCELAETAELGAKRAANAASAMN